MRHPRVAKDLLLLLLSGADSYRRPRSPEVERLSAAGEALEALESLVKRNRGLHTS